MRRIHASPFPDFPGMTGSMTILVMLFLGLTAAAATAATSPAPAPIKVRLALQWNPQSQFAGYYMARDKGLYAAAGLDVDLIHGDSGHNSLTMLLKGEADLATSFLTDAIIAASASPGGAGAKVASPRIVQVAQVVRRSNLMLVGWKEAGIAQAGDLAGRKVSYWQGSFSSAFEAFFIAQGVIPVRIPQYYSVNLFLRHGVAACAAMEYNEYHRIWQAGINADRITAFLMRDYNLGFPEDGIYASAAWAERNPGLTLALRTATIEGWKYAQANPEETMDIVLAEASKAGVSANRPHEKWMLSHILNSIFVPGVPYEKAGILDREEYERTALALKSAGLLVQEPRFESFAPFEGRTP